MKNIVLFASIEYGKNKKIKKLCVSDEKLEKHFVFEVDQKRYKKSLDELFVALEKFCKEDCNCYDSGVCDIFFLRRNYNYDNPVETFLGKVDWICVSDIEFNYLNKLSHIKNPLSFNDFVKQIEGDENTLAFVVKVYKLYKREIDKESFTDNEVKNMVEYVKSSKLFEKTEDFYEQKLSVNCLAMYLNFSVSEALVRLARFDRVEFIGLVDSICNQFLKVFESSYSYVYIIKNMTDYIVNGYTEKTDFEYWLTAEAQDIGSNKYFSIFEECKHYELLKILVNGEKLIDALKRSKRP